MSESSTNILLTDTSPQRVESDDSGDRVTNVVASGTPNEDTESAFISEGDRRFLLASGTIFLIVMTIQYVRIVLDTPKPLTWVRGEAHNLFRVDVNKGTWTEWMQLEGIGPEIAMRIIAEREAGGPFESIDEIVRVDGIGPTTLDRIRPWLTIGHENSEQRPRDTGNSIESASTEASTE